MSCLKSFGSIGSVALTFIGNKQTNRHPDRQAKYVYSLKQLYPLDIIKIKLNYSALKPGLIFPALMGINYLQTSKFIINVLHSVGFAVCTCIILIKGLFLFFHTSF